MSNVAGARWAVRLRAGCGIVLGVCVLALCGCEVICDGTYIVEANYANSDTDNIHMFVSGRETFDVSNRVTPGNTRRAQYQGSFFEPIEWFMIGPVTAAVNDCDDAVREATNSPQTWTFQAGRNGVVLATQTVTIRYEEIENNHTYSVDVAWDGTTLTVTKH